MSAQEFDQMDEELMGMVNDHAAPAAVADAEEIMEKMTETEPTNDENPHVVVMVHENRPGPNAGVSVRGRKTTDIRTVITVVLCMVIAAALILVLAVPELRFWLVALGVISCAEVAGIAIDRWCRR